jgi:triosephosphate isomerase
LRKPILAGNWKMNKTSCEAVAMVKELAGLVANVKDREVVICAPFTALAALKEAVKGTNIEIGAQNMHWEVNGAFTGEISADMLKDAGCKYVIIGHSERRQYFAETDETVNKKVKAALANGFVPIMCVGETLEERESGVMEKVVGTQVKAGLQGLSAAEVAGLVIAYEPIWAIGTGKTASSDDANAVCAFIRKTVTEVFGSEAAEKVRIQYGGSVKANNAAELMGKSDIDGALVGGASLKAADFSGIVNF